MDIWKYTFILLLCDLSMVKLRTFKYLVISNNYTVNAGENISLECIANSSLYLTWEYKPLKDSFNKEFSILGFCYREQQCVVQTWHDQIQITNKSQIYIKNISSSNSGLYSCETSSSSGYDIIKTYSLIFVKTPPKSISIHFNKTQSIFQENELVLIKCSVFGSNPPPQIFISIVDTYKITHLKIDPRTIPLYNISEVNVHGLWRPNYIQHRGFVMCTAINDAGSLTKNSSLLNINFAPKIHSFKFNNISATVNQTLDLSCLVTANPTATIQWFINNGLRQIASSQLITKVQPEMAGNITCLAENLMGSRSRSLKLVVLKDPVITIYSEYKIREKSDGFISCHVKAIPDPDFIKWYKMTSSENNLTIISNDARLNFININRGSAGKYACITKNTQKPTGTSPKEVFAKKYMELIVTYLPGEPWIMSDTDVKVHKGDQIRVLCSANKKSPGEPFPTLSWIDVDTRQTVSKSHILFVEKAESINNGNYQCAAKNELGMVLSSKVVIISVYEPPIIIFHKKSNLFLSYSYLPQTITFPCIFQGQPLNSVNWHYQGSKLSTSENYEITTFKSISEKRATQFSSNLTIKLYSPNFSKHSTSKFAPSGIYSCESTNQFGTVSFDYGLIIKYPPFIKLSRHEHKVAGSVGQDIVTIKCQVESIEETQIAWFRTADNMDLSKFDKKYGVIVKDIYKYNTESDLFAPGIKITELKVYDLMLGDFTSYSCVATNDQGSSKGIIELVFKSKPDIPYDVKITTVEWDSVTISWKSGFNGGLDQSFEIHIYSDASGYQNVPFYTDKIENKLTLKGLYPNTNYSVQLYALNVIGKSGSSSSITCVTKRIKKFDSIYAKILSDQPIVAIIVPDSDLCANLDYTRDNGRQWFNIEHCVKFNSTQVNNTVFLGISRLASLNDLQTGMVHLRLTFCLLSRPGICSNHMVLDNPKNENPTTQTMILIIAVVCFVLIIILVVLFIICCIRFKYRCAFHFWCCYCCFRRKYQRSKVTGSRSIINKRVCSKQEIMSDGRMSCDRNLDDTVMSMESPNNYCSNLMRCSSPHIINNKLQPRIPNDIYSSFTCQHQTQPPIYYEGSSFLQPTLFSWPQNLNTQSYEASSSNSHSSAGSSNRTINPKSCLKYRTSNDGLPNNVIINQKSLLELNERMQLPDVTSEAIHFVKSSDLEHILEAAV